MPEPRWVRRPDGSNWGDFGPDDRLGRLNLITPHKVRQGIAEVREGIPYCLSLPLDVPGGNVLNPNRFPPEVRPNKRAGQVGYNFPLERLEAGRTDVVSDDLALLYLQYSTQWDSLAHAGSLFDADGDGVAEAVYYNGFRAGSDVVGPNGQGSGGSTHGTGAPSTSSGGPLAIDAMADKAVQGRAVMVDLRAHLGEKRTLVDGETLADILTADSVEVEEGDVVCLHTGFAEELLERGREPDPALAHGHGAVLDGRDPRLLRWITDSGLAALVADNYAVEQVPAAASDGPSAMLPLHEHCLFKLGVHLGELWRLTPLARHLREQGRSRFLLTAPPLNLPGAVGSPVTPVGTV